MATSSTLATRGKSLVLGLLLLLLLLPAIQAKWPLLTVRPLGGYFDRIDAPKFSWAGLWNSDFQPELERYLTDRLGFRPWLVRWRNQLAYSTTGKILSGDVQMGKDQNIFQRGPIGVYMGRRYLGEAEIAFRAKRLRRVQDSLRAHGTQLLFLLAPGKARIVPQYLPDSCEANRYSHTTNYSTVCEQFAKYGVNTLDATALAERWRDAGAPYPLFTRTGTHWSGYLVARVADTLFHRVESLTGRDLPDFGAQGPPTVVTRAEDLRYTDNDLGELINLAIDIPPYPTAYPNVVFKPEQGKQRANMLIIGDSFAQSFYGFYPYYDRLLTPSSRYWNYNQYVYWPEQTPGEPRAIADLKLADQLRGRHLVLFVATEENLANLAYGFIDQAFNLYCPITAQDEAQIQRLIDNIKNTPEWQAKIAERALRDHIPLEAALRQDALFMYDKQR